MEVHLVNNQNNSKHSKDVLVDDLIKLNDGDQVFWASPSFQTEVKTMQYLYLTIGKFQPADFKVQVLFRNLLFFLCYLFFHLPK